MRRAVLVLLVLAAASRAGARASGDPIRVAWDEGDVAGFSAITADEGGPPIGFVEYHQRRRGALLEAHRIARFDDGSSDEDEVTARIGATLETVRGRSVVRDPRGEPAVELAIDVAGGRITGAIGTGAARRPIDERVDLPAGTYFGPLVFLVLKNFDANADDGVLRFRTVAPTPAPRVLDLEITREGAARLERSGIALDTVAYVMRPAIHWLVDPLVRLIAPDTHFFLQPGRPPALARFDGPRNYAGQRIRLE